MPLTKKVLISCALTCSAVLVSQAGEPPIVQHVADTNCACVDDTACACCEPAPIHFNTPWCCPGLSFTADVLILNRSDAPSQTLVRDQNTGAEILNAEDLDFNAAGAMRYRLLWQDACCNGWEAGYFGLDSWNATDRTDGISPLYEGPGIPIPSSQPGTVFQTDYGTDLDSFELNRRIGHNAWLTFVHGFRWLHLREQLSVYQVAPVSRGLFSVDTDNQMYGYQVGFDSLLYSGGNRFQIDTQLRSAILYNNADASVNAPLLTGVPGFVDSLAASDDHTAFFGSLGFNGSYWVGGNWAVRAGYNLMWLEGVALAPPQIPVNNLIAPGTSGIDTGTGLFFHGASVGLVATW